ncbi:MAG TPA: secretin N-terminal domain-containing protein, partial [Luteolibacter sp.]|nr:secretin N-terminal domain-containing protein [Luteolibacter sp.]
KNAGKQYFHNAQIAGPAYTVTGHLNNGDPLQQMEELAFMYGLSLHVKGNTIYALTQAQLSQLPSSEFHYQLRYLRPSDVESIKDLIRPVLSPGTGIVNFEPKTNTIIIIDSANRIEAAQRLLHGIDKAKGQIIVETKILRVNSSAAERTGIDWSGALGPDGTSMGLARNLNAIFGIATDPTDFAGGIFEQANLVLSPFQVDGLLRALAQGQLASQISNPTLITEDNERSTISIIDRVPIITTQTTAASAGAQPTVTEEVRYKIDQSDKTIDTDPESHREIGISLVVTPTLLPDGTVRMKMRPRSAQITGEVIGATNNRYPEVTESMIETLARVPNGHSLVVGGFYGETNTDGSNKVPLLGDIPVLNFFFKSKETVKEKTSLVFIVTPTSYDPTSGSATERIGSRIRNSTSFEKDYNWVEPDNPGPAHEANMKRSIRGLQPDQAPYYPRPEELQPAPSGGKSTPSTQGKPRFSSFR